MGEVGGREKPFHFCCLVCNAVLVRGGFFFLVLNFRILGLLLFLLKVKPIGKKWIEYFLNTL